MEGFTFKSAEAAAAAGKKLIDPFARLPTSSTGPKPLPSKRGGGRPPGSRADPNQEDIPVAYGNVNDDHDEYDVVDLMMLSKSEDEVIVPSQHDVVASTLKAPNPKKLNASADWRKLNDNHSQLVVDMCLFFSNEFLQSNAAQV